jgi:hypothetical protein
MAAPSRRCIRARVNEPPRLTQAIPSGIPRLSVEPSAGGKPRAPDAAGLRSRCFRRSHGFSQLLQFGQLPAEIQ